MRRPLRPVLLIVLLLISIVAVTGRIFSLRSASVDHPCHVADGSTQNWLCMYVAVGGKDTNPGTFEAPFATLDRGVKEARALGKEWKGDVVVSIRGGTYHLSQTLTLQPDDSGKNGHRLVIRPYADERVRISGGVPVTGWSDMKSGGIWGTGQIPAVDFRHLTVNGERATRSRHPNGESAYHTIAAWDPAGPEFAGGTDVCDPAKIRGAMGVTDADAWFAPHLKPEELRHVEVFAERQTGSAILRIASVGRPNEGGKGITYITPQSPERERLFTACSWQQPNLAYRFENSMAFLDEPGEWYLDASTRMLYYIPKEGERLDGPSAVTVIAPVLETLIRFQGTKENRVRDVVVRGLELGDTTWFHPNREGFVSLYPGNDYRHDPVKAPLAWWNTHLHAAAIHLTGTERVTLERNVLRALGGMGIDLHDFTHETRVDGNAILASAGIGIVIHGEGFTGALDYPRGGQPHSLDDQVTNNRVQAFGLDYWVSAGIAASYPAGLRIEHNEVSDGGGIGIMIGWYGGWTLCHKSKTVPNPPQDCETSTERVRIVGNRIFRVARIQDDVGGIYTLGHQSPSKSYANGLQVRDNHVHDLFRPNTWVMWGGQSPYAALYIDGDTSFTTVANNIFEIPAGPGGQMVFLNPDEQTSVPPHDILWSDTGHKVPVSRLDGNDNPKVVGDNASNPAAKPSVRANAGLSREYRDIPKMLR